RVAGWRAVFVAAAATLGVIAVGCALTLRETPRAIGLPEPAVNEANVYGTRGSDSRPTSLRVLLRPFAGNRSFWLVCLVSTGLTMLRETFNAWTPTYLVDVYGLTQGAAAQKSSLFPLVGGLSVLVV